MPFVVTTGAMLPYYLSPRAVKLAVLAGQQPAGVAVIVPLKGLVAAAYLALTLLHVHQHLRVTPVVHPRVRWFHHSMVALAATVVVMSALIVGGVRVPVDADMVGTLFICGSTYVISWLLICHPDRALGPDPVVRPKYVSSPLRAEQKQALLDRLTRHMEQERAYLDMHLSLERLSHSARIQPSYVSQVLNECGHTNFYEFVNAYRVRAAIARLTDPAGREATLLAIAHESGFASKASFNRAFKRVTGLTPTEYVRTHAGEPVACATAGRGDAMPTGWVSAHG